MPELRGRWPSRGWRPRGTSRPRWVRSSRPPSPPGRARDDLVTRLAEVGESGISRDPLALARGLFARSLLRAAPFRRAVERLVVARRFADLAVPLTVTVVDLDSGALLVFGAAGEDAPLVDVLCAACALPVYFPPADLAGRRCGDGGLRGPLPLEVAARVGGELVVAVDVGPGFDAVEADSVSPRPVAAGRSGSRRGSRHADGQRDGGAAGALAGGPRPAAAHLRAAEGRAERHFPGGSGAAVRRRRLPCDN